MPGTVKSELFPGAVRKNTNVTGFEDTGKARFPEFILDNGHFITALPLILHGFIGKIFLKESIVNIDLSTILTISVSLFTMFLMPFFFAFLFRDIGKTLSVPLILFFLMILLMNGDHALFLSKILPMGQLRLISLHPFASSLIQFVLIDFLWIFILYMGAYWTFKRSDLK